MDHSSKCQLYMFPASDDLTTGLQRISVLEEDEQVEKDQLTQDTILYGSRRQPQDAVEYDEAAALADPPLKRNASEFSATIGRPAKMLRTSDVLRDNNKAVTAIDWNCGRSPLDAWLNQSALPSAFPLVGLDTQSQQSSQEDQMASESAQIKYFRRVHIAKDPKPRISVQESDMGDQFYPSNLKAQIFYRNILDRYPMIPHYLAGRLADANCCRAHGLQIRRSRNKLRKWHSRNKKRRRDELKLKARKVHRISDQYRHNTI